MSHADAEERALATRGGRATVLLAGNPNAGKTTLFNALTGGRARVGNYPGVTVDRAEGKLRCSDTLTVSLVDLPGTYSLSARSPEEAVAVDALLAGQPPDAVIVVVDATTLTRNLYLALQMLEAGLPVVVALNMMDVLRKDGTTIDLEQLSARLAAPVVAVSATKREGFDLLKAAVESVVAKGSVTPLEVQYAGEVSAALEELGPAVDRWRHDAPLATRRAWALWALLSLGDDELADIPDGLRDAVTQARQANTALDASIISSRYALLDEITAEVLTEVPTSGESSTQRIDKLLLHGGWGSVAFLVVMFVVFEALFSWSEPMIGFIEDVVKLTQGLVGAAMPEGPFRDLLVDGVIAGVGNVIVFVPQIALLFLMLGFLEDSGYLARVAFLIDRIMSKVGLHGKAFVPLLSGCACAIPAVMATRTIEARRDRIATMLALPLMSCSARLPVYVLVIAVVFAGEERVLGVFSVGAVMLFAMYAVSIVATLAAAAVLRRTVLKGPRPTLVLELPPYRWPAWRSLLRTTWSRVRSFLVDAGTIILALTIVLWALLSYPKDDAVAARFASERESITATVPAGAAREARLSELANRESGEQMRHSVAGRVGIAIEPVIEPLGFDWRIGVGLIGAFAAREVFVSTMGIVFGIGEEEGEPVREALAGATWQDGRKLMTPLSGLSLMLFFVFACQCMSTLAVVRRESGTWRWPLLMFSYMSVLAYVVSLSVYQLGAALGVGTG